MFTSISYINKGVGIDFNNMTCMTSIYTIYMLYSMNMCIDSFYLPKIYTFVSLVYHYTNKSLHDDNEPSGRPWLVGVRLPSYNDKLENLLGIGCNKQRSLVWVHYISANVCNHSIMDFAVPTSVPQVKPLLH